MNLSDCYFAREGKGDLFKFPPRKDPPQTDWHEYTVREVDLSAPVWDSYTMELSFVVGAAADEREMLVPGYTFDYEWYTTLLRKKSAQLIPYTVYLQSISSFRYHKRIEAAELTATYEVTDPEEVWQSLLKADTGRVRPIVSSMVDINRIGLDEMGIGVTNLYDTALMPQIDKEPRWFSESAYRSGHRFAENITFGMLPREVALQCVIPYTDEEQLRASLALLAQQVSRPGAMSLNESFGYYTHMSDCRLTRSHFAFTLWVQMDAF